MKLLPILASSAMAATLLSAAPASAAEFFFNFETSSVVFGGPLMGSGVFTTSDTPTIVGGQSALAVTGITGTVNGAAITGPTLSTFGNFFPDAPTFVDGSGIRFNTTAGNNIALFYNSIAASYQVNGIGLGRVARVTANAGPVVAAVPEPATWAMMLLGFGLIGGMLRSAKVRERRISFAT